MSLVIQNMDVVSPLCLRKSTNLAATNDNSDTLTWLIRDNQNIGNWTENQKKSVVLPRKDQPSIGSSPQLTILQGFRGTSDLLVSWDSSVFTTSIPSMICPNTTCQLSSHRVCIKKTRHLMLNKSQNFQDSNSLVK